MKRGLLVSLEGPDGAGKSSVLEALVPILEAKGQQVVTTREPGGVPISEAIREVILDQNNTEMDGKTELLLYIASRRPFDRKGPSCLRSWEISYHGSFH